MTIAKQFLDDPEARVIAIVSTAYGSSGFSAQAAALSIPAGRFRPLPKRGILRDDALTANEFDRAVEVEWVSVRSEPDPYNTQDSNGVRIVRWRLHVGYMFGMEVSTDLIHLASGTTETAANALKLATRRAISDAETLTSILSFPEVVGASGIDPAIVDNYREGESIIEPIGGGRMICITPFTMRLYRSQTERYDPSA